VCTARRQTGVDPEGLFERHGAGDWGVIEGKSWYPNRMAVDGGAGFPSLEKDRSIHPRRVGGKAVDKGRNSSKTRLGASSGK
jgi:hypothetical protein